MDCEEWKRLLDVENSDSFWISTTLDLHNQRVIASDVDRTRTGVLSQEEKSQLEVLLTYYCKEYNTSYKQGMNELMAPFLLMARKGMPIHFAYLMFKSFLHRYLPTMFADQSFKPLQAMFFLFKLILRYFDPRMSAFFLANSIEPQSFVTSWYLTLYSGKINDLECLYYLWKEIINEDDVMFSIFISVAIVLHHKDQIACCNDKIVPQLMSQIYFDDLDLLKQLVQKAKELKAILPYSIVMNIANYNIFYLEGIDESIAELQKLACLVLLPCEIVHRAYPEIDICRCEQKDCPWRNNKMNNAHLVLIDCRTAEEQNLGIFPNSVLLDSQAYTDSEFMINFPDQFIQVRGLFHFCMMGQTTYSGTNFDLNTESYSHDIVQNMVENLLQAFLIKGFPYVSVLEGGYQKAHDFAEEFSIELESHDRNTCVYCAKKVKVVIHNPEKAKLQKIKHSGSRELDEFKGLTSEFSKKQDTKREPTEKFIFLCHKFDSDACSSDEYVINVSSTWFGLSLITSDLVQEVTKVKISSLTKLSFLKKDPKLISIRFAELSHDYVFMMKSAEDAKLCVNQITKSFQKSLNFF